MVTTQVGAVRDVQPLGGGDVSRAVRLDAARGVFFLKWGTGAAGQTYAAEAEGLAALAARAGPDLLVPQPRSARTADGDSPGWLLLDWVEPGPSTAEDRYRFGAALAALHRAKAPGDGRYGWDTDNWIGSKPQRNGWDGSWPTFFGERRLRAQAETVRQRGAWDAAWDPLLDRLVARLDGLLPPSPPPSLLHGDLWGGNALATASGRFALIDPAVSVGHREADLAMTELFGGFSPAFYDGYRAAWPLEPGYAERREVYNLFHLINHLTHGPSYRQPVEATLRRFGHEVGGALAEQDPAQGESADPHPDHDSEAEVAEPERIRRGGLDLLPGLDHHLGRDQAERQPQAERDDQQVVQKAEDGDHVRDEVDGAERVGDRRDDDRSRQPRDARVAADDNERLHVALKPGCRLAEPGDHASARTASRSNASSDSSTRSASRSWWAS